MVEFLKKHTLRHHIRVQTTFQTEADSIYYQMAGNIVGLLNKIMLISGFRYATESAGHL